MVEVWDEKKLIDLALGSIDWIAGCKGNERIMPNVQEAKVTLSGLQLAALRELAHAYREKM